MKKSILSLLVVFTLILTGCEKESINSVEASGSITEELGDKSALNRGMINLGVGNRKINMNGCSPGSMKQNKKTAGISKLKQYINCLSVTNFTIKSNSQSKVVGLTSPGLFSINEIVSPPIKPLLKKMIEDAINKPSFVSMLKKERLNITGFSVGDVTWPNGPNSSGIFNLNVVLTPRPFIFPGF